MEFRREVGERRLGPAWDLLSACAEQAMADDSCGKGPRARSTPGVPVEKAQANRHSQDVQSTMEARLQRLWRAAKELVKPGLRLGAMGRQEARAAALEGRWPGISDLPWGTEEACSAVKGYIASQQAADAH